MILSGPPFSPTPRPFSKPDAVYVTTPSSGEHGYGTPSPHYPSGPSGFSGPDASSSEEKIFGLLPPKTDTHFTEPITPAGPAPSPYYPSYSGPSAGSGPSGPSGASGPSGGDIYGVISTTPATDHRLYSDEVDSTIIRNKSKEWYYGIPPGKELCFQVHHKFNANSNVLLFRRHHQSSYPKHRLDSCA